MNQLPLAFATTPSYAPDDFLVSDANREAYDWVMHPERWNSHALRLNGPAASGRTHLAHLWAKAQGARFITLPLHEVTGPIVLDDATGTKDEAALFHLLNITQAANAKLLLVCDDAPLTAHFKLPDLLSRLNALPQTELHLPDDALLAAMIRKQLSDRQLRVADPVIDYLLSRIPRSFAFALKLTRALDEKALSSRKPVTMPLAAEVLAALTAQES